MPSPMSSHLKNLSALTRLEGIDVRPTLLRVLTDLYIQREAHTREEEAHFTELALRLIDEVDTATKVAIARRLAGYSTTPLSVMQRLARDIPAVAERIVPQSPDALRPRATDRTHVGPAIRESAADLADDLAAAARFTDAFFGANSERRRFMLDQLGTDGPTPRAMSMDEAETATRNLEVAALKGRVSEFTRELERALAIPRQYAERVVNDASGEPMLIAARAIEMPIDVLQRILLLVNPAIGNSVRRVFDLSALYRDLPRPAALRMVLLWRHAVPARTDVNRTRFQSADMAGREQWPASERRPSDEAATPSRGQRVS